MKALIWVVGITVLAVALTVGARYNTGYVLLALPSHRVEISLNLLIVLPNGLVKLINALPFVCGDLRRQPLTEIWGNFQRAWQDPRVAKFVDDLARDPKQTASLHRWVYL